LSSAGEKRNVKALSPAGIALVVGIVGLLAVGMVILSFRGIYPIFTTIMFGALCEWIYVIVQKWRLLRYDEEIQRRMHTAGANPTDDPGLEK
jgi:hypothetical protein